MISYVFGSPGAGKTTYACKLALDAYRKNRRRVFCNFDCKVAQRVDLSHLGEFTLPRGSLLIIDEAGIEYNSRSYKSFPKSLISYFKLHRHYGVDIVVISQSWEDVDVTVRRLADRLFLIKKIGAFTVVRRVFKGVAVDQTTHQIIDFYKFAHLLSALFDRSLLSIFWRRWYYPFFDSFSAPPLPCPDYPDFVPDRIAPVWYAFHPFTFLRSLRRIKR